MTTLRLIVAAAAALLLADRATEPAMADPQAPEATASLEMLDNHLVDPTLYALIQTNPKPGERSPAPAEHLMGRWVAFTLEPRAVYLDFRPSLDDPSSNEVTQCEVQYEGATRVQGALYSVAIDATNRIHIPSGKTPNLTANLLREDLMQVDGQLANYFGGTLTVNAPFVKIGQTIGIAAFEPEIALHIKGPGAGQPPTAGRRNVSLGDFTGTWEITQDDYKLTLQFTDYFVVFAQLSQGGEIKAREPRFCKVHADGDYLLILQQPISARERALVTEADTGLARAVLLPEGGLHVKGTIFSGNLRAQVWMDAALQPGDR